MQASLRAFVLDLDSERAQCGGRGLGRWRPTAGGLPHRGFIGDADDRPVVHHPLIGRALGPRSEYTAGVLNSPTGQAVALQIMVDGGPSVSNFLVRKLDESFDNVSVTGSINADFDVAD